MKENNFIKGFFLYVIYFSALPIIIIAAFLSKIFTKDSDSIRVVWGSTPIINFSYWSKAARRAGYLSETFTFDAYDINNRKDWDKVSSEEFKYIAKSIRPIFIFLYSLFKYDIFVISFDGYFLGSTPLRFFQAMLLKIAGKKIVSMPYGGDAYCYKNIRSLDLLHAIQCSYPENSKQQERVSSNVNYWEKNSDAIVPGLLAGDGIGRWDILSPSPICIDLENWHRSNKKQDEDGSKEKITIAHFPNHRGFKGSEFIIEAIRKLKQDGFNVELKLLEKIKNTEVKFFLENEADILVDQLIFTGYAMNAVEGMASGLTVISNLESEDELRLFRRWSFLEECPIVSSSPENIYEILKKLITNPSLRNELGRAGREYVDKYHGFDSGEFLFKKLFNYVYEKESSLQNIYHPLLGEHPNRTRKISHPLKSNKIVG
jgi:glycosyltransferase involved in cell wall biosynthesis